MLVENRLHVGSDKSIVGGHMAFANHHFVTVLIVLFHKICIFI